MIEMDLNLGLFYFGIFYEEVIVLESDKYNDGGMFGDWGIREEGFNLFLGI